MPAAGPGAAAPHSGQPAGDQQTGSRFGFVGDMVNGMADRASDTVTGFVDSAKNKAAEMLGVPPGMIQNFQNLDPEMQQNLGKAIQSPSQMKLMGDFLRYANETDPAKKEAASKLLAGTLATPEYKPLVDTFMKEHGPSGAEIFSSIFDMGGKQGVEGWLHAFTQLPVPIQMLIGGGLMSMVGGMFGGGQGAAVGGLLGAGAAAFAPQLMGMMNQQEDPAAAAAGQAPPAPNSAAPQMQFGAPPAGEPLPLDNIDPNTGLPPQAGMEQNGGLLPPGSWGGMQ